MRTDKNQQLYHTFDLISIEAKFKQKLLWKQHYQTVLETYIGQGWNQIQNDMY